MPESTNPFDSFDEPQTNAFDQFDAPAQKPAGVWRKAADLGLSVAKGVVAVPQAAVGLADLVTGGAAGRAAESVGVRFQDAQDVLTGMQSDDLKAKRKQFADADGVLDKVGVAVTNPSLIANTVAESLPSMGAGAGIGRGVLMAAPRLGAAIAAGVGEGAVQAGQAAEQIRQEDPHGELSAKQAALAAGSGLVTGAIGAGAGRVADALGTGEATQMLVRGTRDVPAPKLGARAAGVLNSTAARVAKGAINEGLLEEVPQSISEQMFQNAAQDKPLSEGVTDNAVMGGLTGGVMGGVAGGISRQHAAPPPAGPLEEAARLALPAPVAYADAEGRVKMDGVPYGGFDTGTQQGTRSEAQPQPVQPLMLRGPQVEVDAQGNARAPGQIPQVQAGETPLETGNFGQGRNSEDVGMRRLPPPTVNVDSAGIARAPGQNVQPRPQREPGPLEAGAAIAQGRNSEAVFPRPNGPQALPGPDISVDGSGRAATPPQRDAQRRQQDAGFQAENDRRASLGLPQLAREGDILAEDGQPFRNGVAAARAAKAAGAGFRAVRVNDREFVVRRDTSDVIDVPAKDVSGSLKVSHETSARTVDDGAHQAAASPHNDRPAPTKNQILAGNAKLGHAKLGGLGVSFESPAGSVREDKQNTPPKWKTPMAHGYHYGYFKRTEAADSSEAKRQGVDAFVKEGLPEDYSGPAFVVDQVDPKTGAFDEHKVIVGPANEREALAAYGKHYEAGWKGGAHVTRMEWPAFKDWVRSGKKELPAVIDPSAPAAAPAAAVPASSEGPRADAAAGGAGVPAGVAPPAAVAPAPKPAKAQPKGLRVGTTPGDAEPVTVRDGVVYVGNYAAVNFDSGDEVRVPPDANPMQIRKALQDSGALTKKQKFFGMGEAVAPAPASQQNADVGTKPGVAVPSPVDGLVVTSVPSAPAPDSTTAAPSQGAGSQQASAATPAAAPAAPSTTRETKAAPPTGGDDLHGFMAGAAPFVLARVKKTLAGVVRNDGRIIQRKALIEEMVAEGGNVTGVPGARRLAVPSGAFLGEDQITKTGMDYAVHLIGQRGAAAAPAAAPQAKTPEQLRSELQQVEADILRAAPPKFSAGGGDVEAAAKHRDVPADLKQRRKDLKDQLRTGQAPAAPAQQAAVHQDPGQPAEPATIQDLGEKIGGARKDTAVSTGSSRRSSEDDGRATWAKRFKISQIVRAGGRIGDIKDEGRWTIHDSRNLDWMKQPKQVGRNTFATKEEAEAFLPIAAVSLKHRAVPSGDGKYEIWRTITDRKRVKVVDREFASRDDAMAYMAQNAAQILETNTTFGEADLPLPPDRARSGVQRRTGNVKGEDFLNTFGLRGVEFGNWNNQDERQALMNDAYDGLMDLADVLGLPPKAMGLNGDLSLAFGARGHGLHSARAHYESERAVINLTKEHGAGSLAHEWFHALDHYFGRQDGKAPSQWKEQADGTRTLVANGADRDMASHGFQISKSGVREEVRKAYEQLVQTIFKKGTQYVEDTQKADEFTGRAKEDLARDLDALRKDLAEQKDPTYWKRNNKPATSEQLAEFDAITKRMIDGEVQALSTDWRSIEAAKKIAHRWTNDSLEQVGAIYKAVRGRTGFDSTNRSGVLDRLRSTMERYSQRLKQLAEAQQGTEKTRMAPTEFAMNARELDQGRGGDYWTTPHEMAARAFQGFVEDKIAEAGGISRFLNYAPENVGILTPWGAKRPYPAGQERKAINAALDRFVKTLQTKETDRGTALFSRAGLRRGGEPADPFAQQRVTMIRQAVQNYAKDWKVSPEIHVIGSLSEAPPEVLSELGVQNSQGASGETDGFYWNGGVYLIAGNIKDATHARRVLFHEALGHFGLRRVFGDDLVPILQQLATMRPQLVAKKAKEYGLDLKNPSDRIMAAEEVLAELAQERPQLGWVQRAIAAIRRWLRAHGVNLGLSDNDVIANYILPARGFVERGQGARTEMADGAVQSKTGNKSPFYSALERQVDQLPAKAMAGDGWASAITGMVNKGAVKADEVEWSGIRDWLAMQEGKVPKEAVQQFLADNGVRVTEVLKDDGTNIQQRLDGLIVQMDALGYKVDRARLLDEGNLDVTHRASRSGVTYLGDALVHEDTEEPIAPEAAAIFNQLAEAAQEYEDGSDDDTGGRRTQYSSYTLPGGKDYREMLLTLPTAAGGATPELIDRIDKRLTDKGYDGLEDGQRTLLAKGGNEAMGMLEDLADRVGIRTDDVQHAIAGGDPSEQYRSAHWDEPNILAHIRMNDRTDADGKKVLFIEEVQSDWAQQGRRDGFRKGDWTLPTGYEVVQDPKRFADYVDPSAFFVVDDNGDVVGSGATRAAAIEEYRQIDAGESQPNGSLGETGVPRGPFVEKTDAWLALALKRIVKYAADNGYERVAFVNGKQSADRYDLSKQVDEVMVERTGDTFNVAFKVKGSYGNDLRQNGVTAEKLVDVVGKEVAEKIADAPQGRSYLSNTDLKVGGEGMKAFYDKIVPAALNKLLPKVGGEKVGEVRIPKTEAKVKDLDWKAVREDMREVAHGDMEFDEFRSRHGFTSSVVSDEDLEALDNRDPYNQGRLAPVISGLVDSMKAKVAAGKAMKQSGFDVTDAMRSATAGGLPMFSRAGALHTDASTFGTLTKDQEQSLKNVGGIRAAQTVRERFDELRANLGLKITQGLFDQFAPIKALGQKEYMLARMSKAADGTMEAALLYGKPFLRDGVADVDVKDGGFAKVMATLKGEHDRFLWWVAAQRASRLKAEGRENLFTDADISNLKTLNAGAFEDGSARAPVYAAALKDLNAFNESTLKLAMESGLINADAFEAMRYDPYVPFYRLMEDGEELPKFRAGNGMVNQQAFKKLKGGAEKLNNDLLQNLLLNWSHLYTASAKNRAAQASMEAAVKMAVAYPVEAGAKGAVKVMQDGKAVHYQVEDPYLLEAITAMHYVPSPLLKPLSATKNLLTLGVTANPAFKIRNLIRDSIAAVAQADLGYNPLKNVADGWKATARDSQTYASMLAAGGLMRFGTNEDSSRVRRQIEKFGAEQVLNESGWRKLTGQMANLWETYQELGDRGENVNRAALYEKLIAQGKSHAEASFMARDLMDFSMGGRWGAVRFLAQTVPFLNARLVGLQRLAQGAKDDPRRFAAVSGAVMLASLALLAAYGDDDDWKRREDWDRDAYWWFKIGDTAFRIPKPFEIGAMGTLAERTAELMMSDEMTGKRFGQRLSNMLFQTFSFDPTPQMFKPLLDVYANKDSFTGRPIEGMSDERLRPQDRVGPRTSEAGRLLGQMGLPDPAQLAKGQYTPLSPKQVDFLLRGYFGWFGTVAQSVSDYGFRPLTDQGVKPAMQLRDVFLAGNFVEALPSGSSRYVSTMYDQAKDIEQAYASYHAALKAGEPEKAAQILAEDGQKIRSFAQVVHMKRAEAQINAQVRSIEESRTLSATEKRDQISALQQRKEQIARPLTAKP